MPGFACDSNGFWTLPNGRCSFDFNSVAANEAAVRLFLEKRISFLEIETIVRKAMDEAPVSSHPSLEDLLLCDRTVREAVFRQYLK